jgi:hypothetical protein
VKNKTTNKILSFPSLEIAAQIASFTNAISRSIACLLRKNQSSSVVSLSLFDSSSFPFKLVSSL